MFSIKIKFDNNSISNNIKKKIDEKAQRNIHLITQEVLKDCNYFAPKLTGNLIGSSLLASNFKAGKIIYNTKYANKVYFKKNVSRRINKNASPRWVRVAKAKYFDKWIKKAQKLMNKS